MGKIHQNAEKRPELPVEPGDALPREEAGREDDGALEAGEAVQPDAAVRPLLQPLLTCGGAHLGKHFEVARSGINCHCHHRAAVWDAYRRHVKDNEDSYKGIVEFSCDLASQCNTQQYSA